MSDFVTTLREAMQKDDEFMERMGMGYAGLDVLLRNHAEPILALVSLIQNVQSRQVLFIHGMSDAARVEWLKEAIKEWQSEIREALAALEKEA